jgi:hypothetical protein
MFRLDSLSCFLTVVATILLGRKMWIGLVVSAINSLVVCVIGLHTSQYGFIPGNVFCICINALNLRAWLKVQNNQSESNTDASSGLLTGGNRLSTSKEAATRYLMSICSEGTLGHSISSLAAKCSHSRSRGESLCKPWLSKWDESKLLYLAQARHFASDVGGRTNRTRRDS